MHEKFIQSLVNEIKYSKVKIERGKFVKIKRREEVHDVNDGENSASKSIGCTMSM